MAGSSNALAHRVSWVRSSLGCDTCTVSTSRPRPTLLSQILHILISVERSWLEVLAVRMWMSLWASLPHHLAFLLPGRQT